MTYNDPFRDSKRVKTLVDNIHKIQKHPWSLMEVCGGQTHAIAKYGIQDLLPEKLTLLHGPGCPVCVTPVHILDTAIKIAQSGVTVCSYGDMLRVPGSNENLFMSKAKGANIKMVYSPMDALDYAICYPHQEVVFFGVGFETTAPANAMAIYMASQQKIDNFSVLCSHVLVPPVLAYMLEHERDQIDGFLAAGHVCTIMGYRDYDYITAKYHAPIIITGFEPVDILQSIYACVRQLENGESFVENQYTRCVKPLGNINAQRLMSDVFEVIDYPWRGLGMINQSGLAISPKYADWDALKRYGVEATQKACPAKCISGEILTGKKRPFECPSYGKQCTPQKPLGAPMVSSEGACSAYYQYHGTKSYV